MDITEAYDILHYYYPEKIMRQLYIREKFDGSTSDSIRTLGYNANILIKKSCDIKDEKERRKIIEAAQTFKSLENKAFLEN